MSTPAREIRTSPATSGSPRAGRPIGTEGRRLQEAFDAVSGLPALAEARRRLVSACASDAPSTSELADIVESDAALAIVVLRTANNGGGPPALASDVVEAIGALGPAGVRATVSSLETYDLLEHPGAWAQGYDRFRRHGLAVRHAAARIATLAHLPNQGQVAIAALLHDVGRLVLAHLHGDQHGTAVAEYSPDERARRERVELGIDHAVVGGVLIRRWGFPNEIAAAVERHHAPHAEGIAAAVRLADLLVHHCSGNRVPAESIRSAAASLGIDDEPLRGLIFEFPHLGRARRSSVEPCPLSRREIDTLRGLAEGKSYKQIAQDLKLSVCTVRTHLHSAYRKIGVVDRAQAVLLAHERGWI